MHRNLVSINILLYSAPGSFQDAKGLQAKDFWIPIIWRYKFLDKLQRNKQKRGISKATKWIKKINNKHHLLPHTNYDNKDNSEGQQHLQRLTDTTLTGSFVCKHRTKQVQYFFSGNSHEFKPSPSSNGYICHWFSSDKIRNKEHLQRSLA